MEKWQLKQLQSLPLEVKIIKSMQRIKEWYEGNQGNVYISFSGGKDSSVLLDLVRCIYPDIPAVFCDTGCIFCAYGIHLEKYPNKFQKLEVTHPKLHDYCINKLNLKYALDMIGVEYTRPKCNKEKYKIETVKISCRVDKSKLDLLMKINNFIKISELIDYLIKNYKKDNDFVFDPNNKYRIETQKIDVRVNKLGFEKIKSKLKIKNNSSIIDYLIDLKIKSVEQI